MFQPEVIFGIGSLPDTVQSFAMLERLAARLDDREA